MESGIPGVSLRLTPGMDKLSKSASAGSERRAGCQRTRRRMELEMVGEGAVELRGIDIHVHPQTEEVIKAAGERGAQMARYFGRADRKPVSFAEMADRYRDLGLMCCLMNSTDITTTGQIPVPNDHLAQA